MTEVGRVNVRSAQKARRSRRTQGVDYIFGIPGAKIDAVFDALVDGVRRWWCVGMSRMLRSWQQRSGASPAHREWCWSPLVRAQQTSLPGC